MRQHLFIRPFKIIGLLVGLLIIFQGVLFAHEFYVSICKIKHNPAEQAFDINIRIFTNDFDAALTAVNGESPRLDTAEELPQSAEWVADYVLDKLQLQADDRPLSLRFLSHRYDYDATEVILRADSVSTVQKLMIQNEILLDLLDGQTNIVRCQVDGVKKFVNLGKTLPNETITF